ncbi:MAG: winged helix DNA-binding domain-containing protein [Actinomycetota bacterium]|nr:winged helix DNA-binding domain-containing protein [Actinomycetota bacterium]
MARLIAGTQCQEPRAGRLQLRCRSRGLTAAAVERARVEERSLLRTWVMRGTIHLVPTEDADWLASLYSEATATWSRRRLEQLGIAPAQRDRGLAAARRALEGGGALPRSEVAAAAARAGFELSAEARVHLAVLLCMEGIACIGPGAGRETTFVAARDWIGERKDVPRAAALAELARRYYRAFAPATERDFAYWGGISLGDARLGIAGAASALEERVLDGIAYVVPRGYVARAPRSSVVRLLAAFDTYLMGYASRRHAVNEARERLILPGGGVLRPTILVDGRFVGVWSQKRSGKAIRIALAPFEGFDEAWLPAIEEEIADIGRFEGGEASLA